MERFLASLIATHAGIIASTSSSGPCRSTFDLPWNAPLPLVQARARSFGGRLESHEFSARNHLTSELLRFL